MGSTTRPFTTPGTPNPFSTGRGGRRNRAVDRLAIMSTWCRSMFCRTIRFPALGPSPPRSSTSRTKIKTRIYHRTLWVFPVFRSFHPGGEILSSTSAMTNRSSTERQTTRSSSENSATPIELGDARMRNGNLRRITSVTLSTWSEISESTKCQVLTWLLLWQT